MNDEFLEIKLSDSNTSIEIKSKDFQKIKESIENDKTKIILTELNDYSSFIKSIKNKKLEK